jgi:hypothetical protein
MNISMTSSFLLEIVAAIVTGTTVDVLPGNYCERTGTTGFGATF